MLMDWDSYINVKCNTCKIVTLHITHSGTVVPGRGSLEDWFECIVCGNKAFFVNFIKCPDCGQEYGQREILSLCPYCSYFEIISYK